MKKKAKKSRAPRKKDTSAKSVGGTVPLLICSGFGAAIGLAVFFSLLLLLGAACICLPAPHAALAPMCIFAILAASFFSGLAATKRYGGAALLCGLGSGAMLLIGLKLIFFAVALISGGTESAHMHPLLWALCLAAVPGGFSALKHNKTKFKNKF